VTGSVGAGVLRPLGVNLVALLVDRGLGPRPGGGGQVLCRLFHAPLARRTSVRGRTVAVLLAGAAGTALLGVVSGPAVVLVAIAVLLGVARGIFLLLHATAVSDRWGTADYGHLSGLCQP
jgi:cyanate permease